MIDKKSKYQLTPSIKSAKEQVGMKSSRCGEQMAMIGVRLLTSTQNNKKNVMLKENKKQCSYISDDYGQKKVARSSPTTVKYTNPMQIGGLECTITSGIVGTMKFPELARTRSNVQKSASLRQARKSKGNSERFPIDIVNRIPQETNYKTERDLRRLPSIRQNQGFDLSPSCNAMNTHGRAPEEQITNKTIQRKRFLPNLKQTGQVIGKTNAFSARGQISIDETEQQSRRATKSIRVSKDGRASKMDLPTLQAQVPFQDQLIGKSCMKMKRNQNPRQKSG